MSTSTTDDKQSSRLIFTYDASLEEFNIPMSTYLAQAKSDKTFPAFDFVGSGVIIIDPRGDDDRVLLVQRAANDSLPLKWEVPGGAIDPDDPSLLHGAARECLEEAGLPVGHFSAFVNKQFFTSSRGKLVCKLTWLTELGGKAATTTTTTTAAAGAAQDAQSGEVNLSHEHEDFVWATEADCRAYRAVSGLSGEKVPIVFASVDQEKAISRAFELQRGSAD